MNEHNGQLLENTKRCLVFILARKSQLVIRHSIGFIFKHISLCRKTSDHLFLRPPKKLAPSLPEQLSQAHPQGKRLEW